MGTRKVRFYHYLLTAIWPPITYLIVGRPISFLLNAVVWTPLVYGLCFLAGIGFIIWAIAIFGGASHANIGAWQRLRLWSRGYEVLD